MIPATLAMGAGTMIAGGLLILVVLVAAGLKMAEPTVPGPLDEEHRLDAAAGAAATTQAASANTTAIDMGAGFAPGGTGLPVAAVIDVTAADRANSDETYNFKLQESADNSTFVDIGPNVALPVAGAVATLDTLVAKGFLTKRYVRLASTLAGTTPSITFKAYLKSLKN